MRAASSVHECVCVQCPCYNVCNINNVSHATVQHIVVGNPRGSCPVDLTILAWFVYFRLLLALGLSKPVSSTKVRLASVHAVEG